MVLSQNMISTLVAHFEKNGTRGPKMDTKCAFWVHILRRHVHHQKLPILIKNIFRTQVKSMFSLGAGDFRKKKSVGWQKKHRKV